MKILLSGSHGLVGSALVAFLTTGGHEVFRLVRYRPRAGSKQVYWNPATGEINSTDLEGFDAVIHLAGENIAAGPWTAKRKRAIRESRVAGTRLLSRTFLKLEHPPGVFICASAVGIYGGQGDELLSETSAAGADFLANVCKQWENAAGEASQAGIRVINTRFGMILSRKGGVLRKLLPIFRIGLAGQLGNGKQYMSWVDLDDVVGSIHYLLTQENFRGPVNITSPHPVTNREFTQIMSQVLFRPAILPVPAMAIRLVFGEMGKSLLLASQRVLPVRLIECGYNFQYPSLKASLKHQLGH